MDFVAKISLNFVEEPESFKLVPLAVEASFKQSEKSVGLALITKSPVNLVQPLNVLCISVTEFGIVGATAKLVQSSNVPIILVTELGIVGAVVKLVQSLNVKFIFVTKLGIVGAVVKLEQ